jgi:hypothetical protein
MGGGKLSKEIRVAGATAQAKHFRDRMGDEGEDDPEMLRRYCTLFAQPLCERYSVHITCLPSPPLL